MHSHILILAVLIGCTLAQQDWYGQCGGKGWSGATTCATGSSCKCIPDPPKENEQALYGQCGGMGYTGFTSCGAGAYCSPQNPWYYQCVRDTATRMPTGTATTALGSTTAITTIASGQTTTTVSGPSSFSVSSTLQTSVRTSTGTNNTTTLRSSITSAPSVSQRSSTSAVSSAPTSSSTGVAFAGVNIAGFDFGCNTDGYCDLSNNYGPVKTYSTYGSPNPDGIAQMQHFARDDNLNLFRLPVGWQWLVKNNLGGTLDPTNLGYYDQLVQGCLATGAYCLIDIHNYARWNGGIIGQSGPADAQFVSLWSQLATKYANTPKIMYGIMNEPHDLQSITAWAATVQKIVAAIRQAGATSQYITLPGTNWQSAREFVSSGSAAALSTVKNPDGTTMNLIFDVHKYLDSDGSGQSRECVTNNIDSAFAPLATWLRKNSRQAILTETGGGNTASCQRYLCEQTAFLNQNADVYLGYVGWAAGSFGTDYELSMTPQGNTDNTLVRMCIAR